MTIASFSHLAERSPAAASFATQIRRQASLVYDLRLTIDHRACYFIVHVLPTRQTAFLRAVAADAGMELTDYGTVLHRGWGEPTDALKAALHAQFGMDYAAAA